MSTLFSKPEQLSIVNDGGIGETIAICDFNTTLLWFRFSEVQLNTFCDKIQKTSRLYIVNLYKYTNIHLVCYLRDVHVWHLAEDKSQHQESFDGNVLEYIQDI